MKLKERRRFPKNNRNSQIDGLFTEDLKSGGESRRREKKKPDDEYISCSLLGGQRFFHQSFITAIKKIF